jgi:hypothetical protein
VIIISLLKHLQFKHNKIISDFEIIVHRSNQLQEHVFNIPLMTNISLDFFVHTQHLSIEINIDIIPFELAIVLICHHDVIRHRRH